MKAVKCACCGGSMKRNGKTSSGAQRWRCAACGASATVRYDDAAARLEEFLSWLLSKGTQLEMPGAGRTFELHPKSEVNPYSWTDNVLPLL